ncbi:hypothetical protein EPN83_02690 [Patescibacteria group bacterium]|nr:MAG: hypothetical protein EPN83_02690 [Patescibacteria group bacterium]
MVSFVEFSGVTKEADVKRIGQHIGNLVAFYGYAAFGFDSVLGKEVGRVLQPPVALGVEFKRALHDFGFLFIYGYELNAGIVDVADRRKTRIVAALGFGVKSALGVGFQIKNKLIRHPELYARH